MMSLLRSLGFLAHRWGAGGGNTGFQPPSSAGTSNPGPSRHSWVSIQPCLCLQRNDCLKVNPWRTCSYCKLTCVGQNTEFPNHWRNHTTVCGESQGCAPESKPNGGGGGWLDNSARAEEKESFCNCWPHGTQWGRMEDFSSASQQSLNSSGKSLLLSEISFPNCKMGILVPSLQNCWEVRNNMCKELSLLCSVLGNLIQDPYQHIFRFQLCLETDLRQGEVSELLPSY